jgi:hypothetical protein
VDTTEMDTASRALTDELLGTMKRHEARWREDYGGVSMVLSQIELDALTRLLVLQMRESYRRERPGGELPVVSAIAATSRYRGILLMEVAQQYGMAAIPIPDEVAQEVLSGEDDDDGVCHCATCAARRGEVDPFVRGESGV